MGILNNNLELTPNVWFDRNDRGDESVEYKYDAIKGYGRETKTQLAVRREE